VVLATLNITRVISASAAGVETDEMSGDGRRPPLPDRRDSVSSLPYYHPHLASMEQVNLLQVNLLLDLRPFDLRVKPGTRHNINFGADSSSRIPSP